MAVAGLLQACRSYNIVGPIMLGWRSGGHGQAEGTRSDMLTPAMSSTPRSRERSPRRRETPDLSGSGSDDRGVELEVIAAVLSDVLLVIHVMPTALRRRKR